MTSARLLEARDHVAAALAIIDDVAPDLPEPERASLVGVLGARYDLARIVRSLDAIHATMTTSSRSAP